MIEAKWRWAGHVAGRFKDNHWKEKYQQKSVQDHEYGNEEDGNEDGEITYLGITQTREAQDRRR